MAHPREISPAIAWDTPIPAILHHLWLTDETPSQLLIACRQSFYRRHPKWTWSIHRRPWDTFQHPALSDLSADLIDAYQRFEGLHGGNWAHTPWGTLADLLRLAILYVYGGFYVDHDLYCLKPLDGFRNDDLVLVNWQDEPLAVTESVIGCRPGDPRILAVLKEFVRCEVKDAHVSPRLTCWVNTYGWKSYPADYFTPNPRQSTDLYRTTPDTHAIHCWKQHEYDLDKLRELETPVP